ncbi:MAG: PIN domain-containing protein [Spirochaetaceae bacterium]|nr:PIN domain-containing protein [Spirochaetaceae bacterium]
MKVLVDTPVWSSAFRKKAGSANSAIIDNLVHLIKNAQIEIIGAIRQEVLSGISDKNKFHELKNKMAVFADYAVQTSDHEFAAECSNICRQNGIQGAHTDFLICALAIQNDWEIFTEDKDFFEYAKYLPIKIYQLK